MNKKITLFLIITLSLFSFAKAEASEMVVKTHTKNNTAYQSAVLKKTAKRVRAVENSAQNPVVKTDAKQPSERIIKKHTRNHKTYRSAVLKKTAKKAPKNTVASNVAVNAVEKQKKLEKINQEIILKILELKKQIAILQEKRQKELNKIKKAQKRAFKFGNKTVYF